MAEHVYAKASAALKEERGPHATRSKCQPVSCGQRAPGRTLSEVWPLAGANCSRVCEHEPGIHVSHGSMTVVLNLFGYYVRGLVEPNCMHVMLAN